MDIGTAIALHLSGRLTEARAAYETLLAQTPDDFNAWHRLGIVHLQLGTRQDAVNCIEKSLAIVPNRPEAHFDLGTLFVMLNRHQDAISHFNKTLALNPAHAGAHNNLGIVLKTLRRLDEAVDHYRLAIQSKPDYAEALNNLGNALQDLKRYGDALQCYEKLKVIRPGNAIVHNNLGNVMWKLRRSEDAKSNYAQALAVAPDMLNARLMHLYLCAEDADWHPEQERELLNKLPQVKNRSELFPFAFLRFVESAVTQKEIAQLYASSIQPVDNTPIPVRPISTTEDKRVRVAYFSGDFRVHPISYLMVELFELHDTARFEIFLCSYGRDDHSDIRKRIEKSGNFIDLHGLPAESVRERIRAIQPDILIDLQGYTENSLSALLAQRLAPLQVSWLGYIGTMGADFIDYIIADEFVIPQGSEDFYSEKIVRLPGCFQPNDRNRTAVSPRARTAYGLPETGLVFCSFNQIAKIRPEIFGVWLEVLNEVKESILWVSAHTQAALNLKRTATERGIDADRLVIANRLPEAEHRARYQIADLALDTYPYGSGTTGIDALWSGCPLVALTGQTMASRMAGAQLHTMGLSELVTHNLVAYKKLLLELSADPARLALLKSRLAQNRSNSPLFDTPRFTRNLERAFGIMMERARSGLQPEHIQVPSLP